RCASKEFFEAKLREQSERLLKSHATPYNLHSFPTRRSSDLDEDHDGQGVLHGRGQLGRAHHEVPVAGDADDGPVRVERLRSERGDRKSTRLNSSHRTNSYAVFCLKKKTDAQGRGIVERLVTF